MDLDIVCLECGVVLDIENVIRKDKSTIQVVIVKCSCKVPECEHHVPENAVCLTCNGK